MRIIGDGRKPSTIVPFSTPGFSIKPVPHVPGRGLEGEKLAGQGEIWRSGSKNFSMEERDTPARVPAISPVFPDPAEDRAKFRNRFEEAARRIRVCFRSGISIGRITSRKGRRGSGKAHSHSDRADPVRRVCTRAFVDFRSFRFAGRRQLRSIAETAQAIGAKLTDPGERLRLQEEIRLEQLDMRIAAEQQAAMLGIKRRRRRPPHKTNRRCWRQRSALIGGVNIFGDLRIEPLTSQPPEAPASGVGAGTRVYPVRS